MPPAPLMFSITTCLPIASLRYGDRMRPSVSTGPPAANGTTMVTGRVGQSWFCARDCSAAAKVSVPAMTTVASMSSLRKCSSVVFLP